MQQRRTKEEAASNNAWTAVKSVVDLAQYVTGRLVEKGIAPEVTLTAPTPPASLFRRKAIGAVVGSGWILWEGTAVYSEPNDCGAGREPGPDRRIPEGYILANNAGIGRYTGVKPRAVGTIDYDLLRNPVAHKFGRDLFPCLGVYVPASLSVGEGRQIDQAAQIEGAASLDNDTYRYMWLFTQRWTEVIARLSRKHGVS